jgi:hypothetical protein
MAKWIRLRSQVPLLVISFLLSSIYRSFVRVWPINSSASIHNVRHGLLFQVGRRLDSGSGYNRSQRFILEVNGSFPFLHVQSSAQGVVSVEYTHTPCISESDKRPPVNSMQFGFGVSPSGNEGVCNANAGPANQFSSNPPIPSPAINIGEPAPTPPERGCGGCGGCESCAICAGCNCGCECDCGACTSCLQG